MGMGGGKLYLTLQRSNQHFLQYLAGFVTVADIFKGLGGILPAHIEEDFFAAAITGNMTFPPLQLAFYF